jgi:acyl dehydratase
MPIVAPRSELASYKGKSLGAGPWFTIDQNRVNGFADVTIDHQFIHVDIEKAKETPFGSTIAHGFLTLSLLVHLTEDIMLMPKEMTMAMNYGFDKIRFLSPVKTGSRVRAKTSVGDITDKESGVLIKQIIEVEIEGTDKPALICEWLTMYACA